jgi:hypothetical protein
MNELQKAEIKRLLDQQLLDLDSDQALAERLRQARAKALGPRKHWIAQHAPVLGLTAVAALLLMAVLPLFLPEPIEGPDGIDPFSLQDLELVTQLEDFEQDLIFYYWLEVHDGTSG